jgi:excinuclease ABC subunit C
MASDLGEKVNSIPTGPGVYLFKDEKGRVVYVGKAASLRNRVRSYFSASPTKSPKLAHLAKTTADFEFIVTESEMEALVLECSLIKRYRPRYNVRFRDDKRYPYIRISWQEEFPRIQIVRRAQRDGAKYYGPFASSAAMHQTLDTLRSIFPYVTCRRKLTGTDERPCLYYYIKRCPAPCIGAISKEEYRALIEGVCLFLEGKQEAILDSLRQQMEKAAKDLEFERAASLRDQIRAIERAMEKQRIVFRTKVDQDVIALARRNGEVCVQVFFVRGGKLIGRESFLLEGTMGEGTKEVLASFLKQFYDVVAYVPSEILLGSELDEAPVIRAWLEERKGAKVALSIPRRGKKRELVKLAEENAAQTLAHLEAQEAIAEEKAMAALADLQERLGLESLPLRIEAYDISNIQGVAATGSMVVFEKGLPQREAYRHFRIKSVKGANDYAMMREVLKRRFSRALDEDESTWAALPHLVVIDGGKGQLSAAMQVLAEKGLEIPAVALAKEREEIYRPGSDRPLRLLDGSPALQLMQRLRDEAHRFALGYHQKLRRRGGLATLLEEIPGIGPKRRRALLKQFGSLEAIRQASLQELAAVEGMNEAVAQKVVDFV